MPALVFDLDGTLVDSLPGIAASLNRALAELGLPVHGLGSVRGFIGRGARILAERALAPGAGEGLVTELERRFRADYAVTWPTGTAPYPGVMAMLAELAAAAVPLALFSNKPDAAVREIVGALFPEVPFAIVQGQISDLPPKPDPAGLRRIAAGLGTTPDACWMVGDSLTDLATARNAGARPVLVTWGYEDEAALVAAGAETLVADPAGLLALLP